MRSLNYIAAAILPVINSAYAGKGAPNDDIVIVTQTRTITYCPVLDWITCDDNDYATSTISRTGGPPADTTTTTTSWKDGDGSTSVITTTKGGTTITTTSNATTITTTNKDGETTTTTSGGTTITTTSGATTITTTTGYGNATTTTGFGNGTTTTGINNGTTTTSACFNSTRTAAPFNFGQGFFNKCNQPGSRDQWCDNKSVKSDTAPDYRTGQTRKYRLEIGLGSIDADANGAIPSFTINGKTPGDAIVANWGDDVEVTVVNVMDPSSGPVNATTIHWHGILQYGTNDQDGVPGVTECGIAPGSSRTYKWHASTYGTSWYHGHLLSQYGGGVRGPIIIHGPASSDYDLDMGAVMLDEKFLDSIFNIGKLYATVRGVQTPSNYLINGKNLNPQDPNKGEAARWIVKAGKKHLFRIINSAAQSGFVFHIDQHKMTVISADMVPIVPYETENLWIHPGQRYNVIVKADQPVAAYDVRAIIQTGCGVNIANNGFGHSNGVMEYEGSCYSVPAASNFTLNIAGLCKDEPLSSLVPVVEKDAGPSGDFFNNVKNLPGGTTAQVSFNGTAINRWYFGSAQDFTGTASSTANATINVNFDQPTLQTLKTVGNYGSSVYGNTVFYDGKDQWVYWVIQNAYITSHPMHLHGHDFAVLGQEYGKVFTSDMVGTLNFKNPMRRDTVLLYGSGGVGPPGQAPPPAVPGYTVIGFKTDNPGAWVMHCHLIWHADLGMGIQIVERASEITDYYSKDEFQGECSALKAYEAGGDGRVKADYESGLKIRHLEEHKFHGYSHNHAVRHL